MARRSEIFTKESIDNIVVNNPFLRLFEKRDWKEYLEVLALLYDIFEESAQVIPFDLIEGVLRNYYADHSLASIEQKISQFVTMAISELEVIRDSHDASGNRFMEATREGKNLLKLCEGFILNRKKYTGLSAQALMASLNNILLSENTMTKDVAITHHHNKIKEYKEDIKRIEKEGVEFSKLFTNTISRDELFTYCDEIASFILSSGEDIKAAIEKTRKELVKRYMDENYSIGEIIGYVVDFHTNLAQTPEYQSFSHAKDVLSYIQGIGGNFHYKDISQILYILQERELIPKDQINRSSLKGFTRRFGLIIQSIDKKINEQINLLKIQVHYVIAGNTKRVQEQLSELMGIFYKNGTTVLPFAHTNPLYGIKDSHAQIGELIPHTFAKDSVVVLESFAVQEISEQDKYNLLQALAVADEATIEKVLQKLKRWLSRHRTAQLSQYPLDYGLTEFYVLSNISFYCDSIEAKKIGTTTLTFSNVKDPFVLINVTDQTYHLTQ